MRAARLTSPRSELAVGGVEADERVAVPAADTCSDLQRIGVKLDTFGKRRVLRVVE